MDIQLSIVEPKRAILVESEDEARLWQKWLNDLVHVERAPGERWTFVYAKRVSGVSRATLQAIAAGQRKRLSRVVVRKLEKFAVKVGSSVKVGDAPVTTVRQSSPPTRGGGRDIVIARRVGNVIEAVIQKDEAEGTTEGREAIASALMDFGRRLRALRGSPDVADIYELAEDIREGRLR